MENNNANNKTNKAKVGKVQVISSEALALAGKISAKFPASDYKEVYELLNDFVDSLNVDEDGAITLEMFWDCTDCNASEDCEDCCAVEDIEDDGLEEVLESKIEDRDWIKIFNSFADVISLNKAIAIFEKTFDDQPYLIMSMSTLKIFEQTCQGGKACEEMDCDVDMDCEDCPAYGDDEDEVYIEHDCEKGAVNASYLHNDNDYIITIDNTLAFGVVKIR